MHGFDVGHQPHGVVGHGRGRSPLNPSRGAWLERLDAHPIGAGAIQRGHVHARHLGQIAQQLPARMAGSASLSHHQADLRQQLLAIAEGHEVKEGGEGLRVAGGGGAAGKDQRWRIRVSQGQVAAIGCPDRDAGQLQHLEDVGAAQFVAEREAQDVEGG